MKLYYRKMGEGSPLIILHGLFGMSDNWMSIAKRSEKHTVYIPDQRNHGRSPHHPDFNYPVLLDDLKTFIETHISVPVNLIGHSMGGKTGMLLALNYPELLNKLIVVDIAPKSYDRPLFKTFLQQLLTINLEGLQSRKEADKRLAEKIKMPAIRQFLLKNLYRDENLHFQWRINLNSLYQNINSILTGNDFKGHYENEVLFVRGGKSDYITDADGDRITEYFPKARIHTIPKATHWVHADAPDELCDALRGFLEE